MRRPLIITAAALAIAAGIATPANADDTVATFAITSSGTLALSVPAGTAPSPLNLGSIAAGNVLFSPSLGTVTVTDTRANIIADWTLTATGTHFDNQGGAATPATDVNHRVANTAVTYTAVPTVSVGTGVATPTVGTLAAGATVVYVGSGSNTVTWNPTLAFTLLATQSAGTYKGTVTHSVS